MDTHCTQRKINHTKRLGTIKISFLFFSLTCKRHCVLIIDLVGLKQQKPYIYMHIT